MILAESFKARLFGDKVRAGGKLECLRLKSSYALRNVVILFHLRDLAKRIQQMLGFSKLFFK